MTYHHWRSIADDGALQTFACIRCHGKLTTPGADPTDRRGARTWSLAGDVRDLRKDEGPPPCEGRGKVSIRLVGRHYDKRRA